MFVCVPDWSFKCTLFLWQTKRILLRPWILDAKESPKTALFLFEKKESGRTHLHLRWRQKCNSKVNFRKWMRTPTHSPGNFCHVCKLPTKRCYFTPITNFITANIVNDFPTAADHISKYGRFLLWWGGGCSQFPALSFTKWPSTQLSQSAAHFLSLSEWNKHF